MADVAATLAQWSSTTNSNTPSGSTTVGSGVDDNIRELQGVIVRGFSHKGSDIASAATTDLGAVEGLGHDITGVTTITGFGTVRAGILKVIKFEGALTLTHNATSLILPGAANITTADGDVAIMFSEGSGNWRCWGYMKAASVAATLAGTETLTNKTLTAPVLNGALSGDAIAAQAEMETGTATDSIVAPGRLHFHPAVPKGWVYADTTGNPNASHNVTSITDHGAGNWAVNWATDFSSANYCAIACAKAANTSAVVASVDNNGFAAGRTDVWTVASTTGVLTDPNEFFCVAFGDQA